MIKTTSFLEWAHFAVTIMVHPKSLCKEKLNEGKNVILEIEVQGAPQIKKIFTEAVTVFLIPPDKEELRKRLTGRGTEDNETIEKRIQRAAEEIELLPNYDYVVINDEIENAVERINCIVKASKFESHRYIEKIKDFK